MYTPRFVFFVKLIQQFPMEICPFSYFQFIFKKLPPFFFFFLFWIFFLKKESKTGYYFLLEKKVIKENSLPSVGSTSCFFIFSGVLLYFWRLASSPHFCILGGKQVGHYSTFFAREVHWFKPILLTKTTLFGAQKSRKKPRFYTYSIKLICSFFLKIGGKTKTRILSW